MVGGMDDHKDMPLAEQWAKKGHVVVRGIYSAERTQRLEEICERILAQWRERNPETGEPGGSRDSYSMRHRNHTGYFSNGEPGFTELMDAIADPRVPSVCRSILRDEPLFRCTSLFMNPPRHGHGWAHGIYIRSSRIGTSKRRRRFLPPRAQKDTACSCRLPSHRVTMSR